MQPLFKLSPGPLLRSGLGHLARYCTHQETMSGRPKQLYLSFDQDCRPEEGPLFKLDTNKRRWVKMQLLFKLSHGQLLKPSLGKILRSSGV